MKAYRLKHIPTGLYYQPTKGSSNLSKQGKVYLTNANALTYQSGVSYIWIDLKKEGQIYRIYGDKLPELREHPYNCSVMQGRVLKDKFEKEYIENNE